MATTTTANYGADVMHVAARMAEAGSLRLGEYVEELVRLDRAHLAQVAADFRAHEAAATARANG